MKTMMRAAFVAVALLSAPMAFAQDATPSATVRVVLPAGNRGVDVVLPTPAPTPVIAEPVTPEQFMQLLVVFTLAAQRAANLGTLGAILIAALALTYLLMYLVKNALKGQIPENYKKILKPTLVVLTGVASGIGYYIGGPPAAVAAGIGAAASGVSHDLIDAFRYGPNTKKV